MGFVIYSLFLAAIFGLSVYETHVTLETQKMAYLDRIRGEIAGVHSRVWNRGNHVPFLSEQRKLQWLHDADSYLAKTSSWPFSSTVASQALLISSAPIITAIVERALTLAIK